MGLHWVAMEPVISERLRPTMEAINEASSEEDE
jgi:hypothetical protein